MDTYDIFMILMFFSMGSAHIRIKELNVPESIEEGTVTDVTLDCDFENDEPDAVLTWYYNGQNELIYQWIVGSDNHGARGLLKEKIDTDFKIGDDKKYMYRALRLKDITPDVSGNYTCKVSSSKSEDTVTKKMVIYKPPDEPGLDLHHDEEEDLIHCSAYGMHPKPLMQLYISGINETEKIIDNDSDDEDDDIVEEENGLYNISLVLNYTINEDNLTSPAKIICELTIPGTDFYLNKSQIFIVVDEEDVTINLDDNLTLYETTTTWIDMDYTVDSDIANATDIIDTVDLNTFDENNLGNFASCIQTTSFVLLETLLFFFIFN